MSKFKPGDKVRLKKDVPLDKITKTGIGIFTVKEVSKENVLEVYKVGNNTITLIGNPFIWGIEWFEKISYLENELFEI